jgi:hypothetical protein
MPAARSIAKATVFRTMVGIGQRGYDPSWGSGDNKFDACWAAVADVRAWFERDVDSCSSCRNASFIESHGLGMRSPPRLCPAYTDNLSVLDDDASDVGIW